MIVSLLLASAAIPADPLAPARDGMVQCYHADEAARTCRSIASYQQLDAAHYTNVARVLVSAAGPVIMETATPVTVRAGTVCGFVRAEDILAGKLWIGERALASAEAQPILRKLAAAMAPLDAQEICTAYLPEGDAMLARATIAGTPHPDADEHVRWVHADAGYHVAP